ncbi:iron complex outermembrane recepter protein [Porphyromonadaceae bacterium NLAE-zl-C104]|nr:iron complex outermembrane recepter protein [Porphyromonadaceae bacterium NLAE-zl-C104]
MDKQLLIAIKTLFFFLGFLFIVNLSAFAQQNSTFKGKVYDNNDRVLVGATVFIEQLGIGDDTDGDGNFEIDRVPAGQYKVVVSYVGFNPTFTYISTQSCPE